MNNMLQPVLMRSRSHTGRKGFQYTQFLQWFVMEQVEEEASAQAILDKLSLGGKNILYQFDRDIMSFRAQPGQGQTAL